MGERFLNNKTKEVFLGENAVEKINEVCSAYLPYQKVLVITNATFKVENEVYYEGLLRGLKMPNVEYVFTKKVNVNKASTTQLLKAVTEEVACILVIGNNELIDLVKIVAYIKNIPYIILPSVKMEPQYLCKIANITVDGLVKFYKVNAPLAVVVEQALLLKQKKLIILDMFCSITTLATFLLDEFLVGASKVNTMFSKHYEALKTVICDTLKLNETLYNYKPSAIITLIQNAFKAGLILQNLNCMNIDSATLTAHTLKKVNDPKLKLSYYKMINSLFLVNVYESFILNLKANNYLCVNIKNRIKIGEATFQTTSIKKTVIESLKKQENLTLCAYHIKEFEEEMLEEIKNTKQILLKAYTVFKRMNLSLSYYIEKTLNTENYKKAICLAPDLSTTNNFLKVICQFGVLDYNF